MLLARHELQELTGCRRSDAQRRALDHMGIPYTVRPNGTVAVLRVVAEQALGGRPGTMLPANEPELMP